jgi:hypothetical protein
MGGRTLLRSFSKPRQLILIVNGGFGGFGGFGWIDGVGQVGEAIGEVIDVAGGRGPLLRNQTQSRGRGSRDLAEPFIRVSNPAISQFRPSALPTPGLDPSPAP